MSDTIKVDQEAIKKVMDSEVPASVGLFRSYGLNLIKFDHTVVESRKDITASTLFSCSGLTVGSIAYALTLYIQDKNITLNELSTNHELVLTSIVDGYIHRYTVTAEDLDFYDYGGATANRSVDLSPLYNSVDLSRLITRIRSLYNSLDTQLYALVCGTISGKPASTTVGTLVTAAVGIVPGTIVQASYGVSED